MMIFVYGLLRPGFEGAELLGNAQSLGAATVVGQLYDLGGFPGLVPGDGLVHGEVCRVDADRLPALDRFEDYDPDDPEGSLYVRVTSNAWLEATGDALSVQVYQYNRHVSPTGRIMDGDYAGYVAARH